MINFFEKLQLEKTRTRKRYLLRIVFPSLLVIFGVIILLSPSNQNSSETSPSVRSKHSNTSLGKIQKRYETSRQNDEIHQKAIELVNRNLQLDQTQIELREDVQEAAARVDLKAYRENPNQPETPASFADRELGVEVFVDDGSQEVLKDINARGSAIYDSSLSPEEIIGLKVQKMNELHAYEHKQKVQYVRAFVENARKRGYFVQLNDQLEVVKVRPIPTQRGYRGGASINKLYRAAE